MSAIGRREQEEELSRIVGKKVTKVSFSEEKHLIVITFDDESTFVVAAQSGGGADGGWYNWTAVKVNDVYLINFP